MEGKAVTHALWGIPTHSFYARVDTHGFSSSRGSEAPGRSGSRAERFVSSGSRAVKGWVGRIRVPDACPLSGEDASHQSMTTTCRSPVLSSPLYAGRRVATSLPSLPCVSIFPDVSVFRVFNLFSFDFFIFQFVI